MKQPPRASKRIFACGEHNSSHPLTINTKASPMSCYFWFMRALIVFTFLCFSCGEGLVSPMDASIPIAKIDSGVDSGNPVDSGIETVDSGTELDAGNEIDSGFQFDSGMQTDGSIALADSGMSDASISIPDASVFDSGVLDSGTPRDGGAPDAGNNFDAGIDAGRTGWVGAAPHASLANIDLHESSRRAVATFIPPISGTLDAIQVYWVGTEYPGYGSGTGGSIAVQMSAANSLGLPVLPILSQGTLPMPNVTAAARTVPVSGFQVIAGQFYSASFRNTDANPAGNYSSLNGVLSTQHASLGILAAEPFSSQKTSPGWRMYYSLDNGATHTASYEPTYPDGWNSPMLAMRINNIWYGRSLPIAPGVMRPGDFGGQTHNDGALRYALNANQRARQKLRLPAGIISKAEVSLHVESGAGLVTLNIKDATGASVATSTAQSVSAAGDKKHVFQFAPKRVTQGDYTLELSVVNSINMSIRSYSDSSGFQGGSPNANVFGNAQVSNDSGANWVNAERYIGSGVGAADAEFAMQVYFSAE
jgi:hypothetical protein